MKDPGLLADGKKINVDFEPISGEDVAKMITGFYAATPELLKKAYNDIYTRYPGHKRRDDDRTPAPTGARSRRRRGANDTGESINGPAVLDAPTRTIATFPFVTSATPDAIQSRSPCDDACGTNTKFR